MTVAITKPIARTVFIGDLRYKAVMTTHGVRLTEHGKRRGVEVSWSSLISLIDRDGREVDTTRDTPGTGVPEAITKDVAREIRTAVAALSRAHDAFCAAGVLPPEVLADVAEDPFNARPTQEPDWFVEPLLTLKELASIFRLPSASVRALGIKSVQIAGEVRFRQSVVRAYLIEQESAPTRQAVLRSTVSSGSAPEQTEHPYARRFKSFYGRDR